MEIVHPRLFQPLSAGPQSVFHTHASFNAASLPVRLWDGIFPMPEGIRKLFAEPHDPSKQEKRPRRETGEKRFRPRRKFRVEVLAYPLRPHASDIPLRGDLKNMSQHGVCVEFLKVISENHLFLLDFQLPDEKRVGIPARVVWSRNRLSGFELLGADHAREILKKAGSA